VRQAAQGARRCPGRSTRGRAEGGARGGAQGGAADRPKAARDDACHNCGRPGHWAKDCPQRRRGGQAHVAEALPYDEAALFLLHEAMELHPAAPSATTLLHLNELRVRVLGNGSDDDRIDGWYLNSGATHHMTGRWEFFSDLDTDVGGSVRFGDSSAIVIKGPP